MIDSWQIMLAVADFLVMFKVLLMCLLFFFSPFFFSFSGIEVKLMGTEFLSYSLSPNLKRWIMFVFFCTLLVLRDIG